MKVKQGVSLAGLKIEMRPVLKAADKVWKEVVGHEVEVTSTTEGKHSAGSYHPFGYAVDLGTRDENGEQYDRYRKAILARKLQVQLVDEFRFLSYPEETLHRYDIVVESDHIHVEFEVDKP